MSNTEQETTKGLKPKGWHSRRHETREAHDAAREAYQNRATQVAKKRRYARERARTSLIPLAAKLELIDTRIKNAEDAQPRIHITSALAELYKTRSEILAAMKPYQDIIAENR